MPFRYKVVVAPSALAEMVEIGKYVGINSPQAALNLVETMEEAFASLEQTPLRGALIPENELWGSQYRHLLRGPYRIIFDVDDKNVYVLKVIHGARLLNIEPGRVE